MFFLLSIIVILITVSIMLWAHEEFDFLSYLEYKLWTFPRKKSDSNCKSVNANVDRKGKTFDAKDDAKNVFFISCLTNWQKNIIITKNTMLMMQETMQWQKNQCNYVVSTYCVSNYDAKDDTKKCLQCKFHDTMQTTKSK